MIQIEQFAGPEDFQEQSASVPIFRADADDLPVENRVRRSEVERLEKEETALAMEMRAWREGHQSLCQEMLRLTRELATSRQRMQLLENTAAILNEERDSWERETSTMRNKIEDNRKRISAVEVESQLLKAERDLLRKKILELQKQQAIQVVELKSSETKARQLLEERDCADRRISELTEVLHSAEQKNRHLLESWSWRLTLPLRRIGRLVRR